MHEALERLVMRGSAHGASPGLRALAPAVVLARGEIVEMGVTASAMRSTLPRACSITPATTKPCS